MRGVLPVDRTAIHLPVADPEGDPSSECVDLDKAQRRAKLDHRDGYLGVFLADKEDLTVQPSEPGEVTVLLQQIGHGDAHAVDLPPIFSPGIMRLSPIFVRPTGLA
jgi:hypothetical protein